MLCSRSPRIGAGRFAYMRCLSCIHLKFTVVGGGPLTRNCAEGRYHTMRIYTLEITVAKKSAGNYHAMMYFSLFLNTISVNEVLVSKDWKKGHGYCVISMLFERGGRGYL